MNADAAALRILPLSSFRICVCKCRYIHVCMYSRVGMCEQSTSMSVCLYVGRFST